MLETGVRVLRLLTAAVTARAALAAARPRAARRRVARAGRARAAAARRAGPVGRPRVQRLGLRRPRRGLDRRQPLRRHHGRPGGAERPAPWRADAPGRRAVRRPQEAPPTSMPSSASACATASTFPASATCSIPTATSAPPRCSPCCARPCRDSPELAFAERLAAAVERLIDRKANVDFTTVTVERVLGLPKDSALALFLLGRTVGWIAHALEQAAHGALIRPRARYTGPRPGSGGNA